MKIVMPYYGLFSRHLQILDLQWRSHCAHYFYVPWLIMTSQWVMKLLMMLHCGITVNNDIARDWVDRDLLFYRLLKYNITGSIYYCIKALYSHHIACVKVNNYVTNWFDIKSGVHQGDSLSPTLFGLFLNDLLRKVKDLKLGVKIVGEIVSILAFADDIVIFAESEKTDFKMYWKLV